MGYRRVVGAVGTILAITLLSGPSQAGPSARAQIEDFFHRTTGILAEATNPKQAWDAVRDLAYALFDGRRASRRALGVEWDRRTGAEREEFARMFADVLERAYLEMVQARLPRLRPPVIRVVGEDMDAAEGRVAIVRTRVESRDGNDVRLDYVMARADQAWRVHDVVIDGVSLVENYRAQFASVLRTSSYSELVARLRAVAGTGEPVTASLGTGSGPDVIAYFDTSSAELGPVARRDLARAAAWLAANGQGRVLVEGHSDQRGARGLNQALAERRAGAVREYLVSRGVPGDRIGIVPYGDREPVCREPVETCWVQNRRAVVRLAR
ncbi:MAG: ABC transporter substrate-binding protein [Candidatus Rokubacteria bacterium]|nr:ABC transporter substrate-binding protein [Candidatus Rokubacteria bacterium]